MRETTLYVAVALVAAAGYLLIRGRRRQVVRSGRATVACQLVGKPPQWPERRTKGYVHLARPYVVWTPTKAALSRTARDLARLQVVEVENASESWADVVCTDTMARPVILRVRKGGGRALAEEIGRATPLRPDWLAHPPEELAALVEAGRAS